MITKEVIEILSGYYEVDNTMQNNAMDMVIEALKKQIPKKPKQIDNLYFCPQCHTQYGSLYGYTVDKRQNDSKISYCLGCGQAIDWN